MHDFLPYGRQTIEQDDIQNVIDVLNSDYLTTGPAVAAFEDELALKTGANEAVVVGNGTQALHLACISVGLKEGDWAIVPSLTFLATANAVRCCGADVLFADVDPETGLLTPDTFQQALDKADKDGLNVTAVLPVHLAGQMVDQEAIKNIADDRGLKIISDSCHALGSTYKDKLAGSCTYEDMATFSFHPVKTVAMGEGGAITTNDRDKAAQMRILRSHGMQADPGTGPWAYKMQELAYNYRASDMQCALGLSQLKKLDKFVEKRRYLADLYDHELQELMPHVLPPKRMPDQKPAWHLYAARFDFEKMGVTRATLMTKLKEKNIGTQVHYIPVHTQPYYEELYGKQDLPGAQNYYQSTLSLPLYPSLELDNVRYVVEAIKSLI